MCFERIILQNIHAYTKRRILRVLLLQPRAVSVHLTHAPQCYFVLWLNAKQNNGVHFITGAFFRSPRNYQRRYWKQLMLRLCSLTSLFCCRVNNMANQIALESLYVSETSTPYQRCIQSDSRLILFWSVVWDRVTTKAKRTSSYCPTFFW